MYFTIQTRLQMYIYHRFTFVSKDKYPNLSFLIKRNVLGISNFFRKKKAIKIDCPYSFKKERLIQNNTCSAVWFSQISGLGNNAALAAIFNKFNCSSNFRSHTAFCKLSFF